MSQYEAIMQAFDNLERAGIQKFGSEEAFQTWMNTVNPEFDNRTPRSTCNSQPAIIMVQNHLSLLKL